MAAFAYDEVPYDTEPNPDAHPRAMETLASLFARRAAPPERARLLELGCGDGRHLLLAAGYLPGAHFVGLDLAARAIEEGRRLAAAWGIGNVALHAEDILTVGAASLGGPFDYVVAHGLLSWVPEPVRERLFALIAEVLAPDGVAFVSFNALPGWGLRDALRAVMRRAAAQAGAEAGPAARVTAALAAVAALANPPGRAGAGADAARGGFAAALGVEAAGYLEHVRRVLPAGAPFSRYVFHDLLADVNTAFTVGDVAQRGARHGLRVLCESPLRAGHADGFGVAPPEGAGDAPAEVAGLAADLAWEGTPFLQVLLTRGAGGDALRAEAIDAMHLHVDFPRAESPGRHRTWDGAVVAARTPAGARVLADAAARGPGFVPVATLLAPLAPGEAREARGDLVAAFCQGSLTLVRTPPRLRVPEAKGRPAVAPHVLRQAQAALAGDEAAAVLTSALHRGYRVARDDLRLIADLAGEPAPQAGPLIDRLGRYAFLVA